MFTRFDDEYGVSICVKSNNVWEYFQENTDKLGKFMMVVASNANNNCKIYLTSEDNKPAVFVYVDDKCVEEVVCSDESETSKEVSKVYYKYLTAKNFNDAGEYLDENEMDDLKDEIDMREEELFIAFMDFLEVVFEHNTDYIYDDGNLDEIQSMLDGTLKSIGVDHGLRIYRPKIITDGKSGEKLFIEYPYETYE